MISLEPNEVSVIDCSNMKPSDKPRMSFDWPTRFLDGRILSVNMVKDSFAAQFLGGWDLAQSNKYQENGIALTASASNGAILPDNVNASGRWVNTSGGDFSITFNGFSCEVGKTRCSEIVCDDDTVEALFKEDINF